jgi:hypothetical protein
MRRVVSVLAAILSLLSGHVVADVKYPPQPSAPEFLTEVERASAVATMREIWRGLLTALERGEAAEASKFVEPRLRLEFIESAGGRMNPRQLSQALTADLECERTIHVRSARCSYWVKNSIGGLEEIRVPFVYRENQWYVSQ